MNVYEIRKPYWEEMFASMGVPCEREIRYGFTTISSKPDYQVAKYVMETASHMPDHMTITKIAKVNTRPKVKARDKARKAARKGKQYLRDLTPMGYDYTDPTERFLDSSESNWSIFVSLHDVFSYDDEKDKITMWR